MEVAFTAVSAFLEDLTSLEETPSQALVHTGENSVCYLLGCNSRFCDSSSELNKLQGNNTW